MGNNVNNRRDFLKASLGLLAVSTVGGVSLYGRILPKSYKRLNGNQVAATYTLKVSDFPTQTLPNNIKIGLTEVGSSIKLTTLQELQMNPDHCERSGKDGNNYPIAVVRVSESGEDAFTAVSTWCPHNEKSQLDFFNASIGESGLFVCTEHEDSCYKADGTWVPPTQSPFPDAPDKDEFVFNVNPDGTPYLTRFDVTFDGDDTITIQNVLVDCIPTSTPDEESAGLFLHQNYPNPVRHATIFQFTLPKTTVVTLSILSTDGKEVARVIEQRLEAGHHNVDFDAKDLPAGTYFYKLETPFGTKTRRMSVVR